MNQRCRRIQMLLAMVMVVALAATGCSDNGGGDAEAGPRTNDRSAVAESLLRDVIVPGYADLATRTNELLASLGAACDPAVDESARAAAQDAWREAQRAWSATRAFRFGPTKEARAMSKIAYPVDPEKVADVLAGSEPVDPASVAALGADRRGLGAVELVLFGSAPLDERNCAFAIGATTAVAEATAALHDAWVAAAIDSDEFVQDGVNGMIFALSDVTDMRLARAAGRITGTPATVDAGPAQQALADMTAVLASIEAMWTGGSEGGFRALDAFVSDDTAAGFTEQLAEVEGTLGAIPTPLAGVEDPEQITPAYEAGREALVILRTEVASQLGVTLQLGDSDGDS